MENITIIVVKPYHLKMANSVKIRPDCAVVAPLLPKSMLLPKSCESDSVVKNTTKQKKAEIEKSQSLGLKCLSAGISASIADMVTFPLDTTKVRLQV